MTALVFRGLQYRGQLRLDYITEFDGNNPRPTGRKLCLNGICKDHLVDRWVRSTSYLYKCDETTVELIMETESNPDGSINQDKKRCYLPDGKTPTGCPIVKTFCD